MEAEGFRDLLQQAEQLTADMDSGTDLPHVERNLAQILEAGQRLVTRRAPASQDTSDVKASILLGSKGYALPKISERLDGLKATTTFEPLEPVRDTDIQGFLKNERENALLSVIEQTRKHTFSEVERHQWDSMQNEWEREKHKILNTLLGSGSDTFEFQHETEVMSSDGVYSQGRSNLDHIEMAYARQVYVYNEEVVANSIRPSLVDLFLEVARNIDDKAILDLWEMMNCMTDLPLSPAQGALPASVRCNKDTQRLLVLKAIHHLESNFCQFLKAVVYENLEQSRLGGVPGTYNLVRSYLKLQLPSMTITAEDGHLEGLPIWALIYYCLRCGDTKAAQEVVERVSHQLGDFPAFFHEYVNNPQHRLSVANDTKIKLQYRRIVKNSQDSFKRAVYCIVGQCDPEEDHAEISDKIDDYLWLKLSQLDFEGDDGAADTLTLERFQKLLYEDYGENHFQGYQNPMLYSQVLVLTGQFEAAVEFLARIEHLRHHAVHMALVLYEMNLLFLPNSCHAPLLSQESGDPPCVRRLNIARLIMMYTRKFEATDAREALQYFFFLRGLKTGNGENMFQSCVSELVLETREFEMLLGRLERDGTRRPGAIDKFCQDTDRIIEAVARDTEAKGMFEEAVCLYDLAKNQDKAVVLMNKLLSKVVSTAASPEGNRDRLKAQAISMAQRYRTVGQNITAANSGTFYLLLDLMTFFDQYHSASVDQALDTIKQLKLLPFKAEEVEHRVNGFRTFTDEIRRNMPDILLATMTLLNSKYTQTRGSSVQSPVPGQVGIKDGGKETCLNYLRAEAKMLIMFAGMLPYRLPGDVNARLVQIEVLMN
ncbi:hypothetical protein ACOMHN_056591 [Nucella lapillus]